MEIWEKLFSWNRKQEVPALASKGVAALAATASIQERIDYVYDSEQGIQEHFMLRTYSLAGKDFIFLQPVSSIYPFDLDDRIIPFDALVEALKKARIVDIVFSLKGIRDLIDIPLAIAIRMMSGAQEQGGMIVICDAGSQVIRTMEVTGVTQLVRFYSSEASMQANFGNN